MRIPGGDLMPARRRRYGGSYGRRRRRNQRVVIGILLVGIGVGSAWYLRKDDSAVRDRLAAEPTCTPAPTPTATVAPTTAPRPVVLPAPRTVTLSVLNGTDRHLLAKNVADQLAAQGFRITTQGNASKAVVGPSQVLYGPGASLPARTVAAWVRDATAVLAPKARPGSVQLLLGSGYSRLSTPAEVAAATRATTAPAVTPSPTPGVLPCRS